MAAAYDEDYGSLDAIREEDGDNHSEGESGTLESESVRDSYKTNTISVSAYRRTWPQTATELQYRFGSPVRTSKPGFIERFYRWNRMLHDERPRYDVHKQVLTWEQLPEDVVLNSLQRSTIWNGDSGLFDIDIEQKELEKIAERFDPTQNNEKRRSARRAKESVLSTKRSTALSMVLRKLSLHPPRLAKLGLHIRSMNENYFDQSVLDVLLKGTVWPSLDEMMAMKARLKDGYQLADPDALLWFLATLVPNTRERLQALAVRAEFDDWVTASIRATSILKSACMEVCTSELLRNLLQTVLMIGNRINTAHGGTEAAGITLKSLSKLAKFKTFTDKTLTALDCIVAYLEKECPELFGVVDDCACVTEAARYCLREREASLRTMRASLLRMRAMPEMHDFFREAWSKVFRIERDLAKTREAFVKARRYFGVVDDDTMDTDEFFNSIADFFVCLDHSVAQHEARERSQASQSKNGRQTPERAADSDASTSSRRSFGRLSVFGRPSSSNGVDGARKTISAARQSIFGRIKPAQSKG